MAQEPKQSKRLTSEDGGLPPLLTQPMPPVFANGFDLTGHHPEFAFHVLPTCEERWKSLASRTNVLLYEECSGHLMP
jgi:hypothetical protein